MDASARFSELVTGPEASLDLAEAALLVAAHAYPGLDVDRYLARLDLLADGCDGGGVDAVRRHVFVDLAFAGNVVDYYDPRNSFLNEVIDRRTGIPITLALVCIEIGRRTGVPLAAVGMPGHVLLRSEDDPDVYVDPFDGVVLDEAGCRALFHRVAGVDAPFLASHLDPIGPRAILTRMLGNLRAIYAREHRVVDLSWVLSLRLAIPGAPASERRELSAALASAGRYREAAEQLDVMASTAGPGADDLRRRALKLRARLN